MNDTVERLRREFDAAFALPHPEPGPPLESFLVGPEFAIRVAELKGVLAAKELVPIPGRRPELVGLAGVRGVALPVFSLSLLLGRGREEPRWILLCDGLGFAVRSIGEYRRLAPPDLFGLEVLSLPKLVARIQGGAHGA